VPLDQKPLEQLAEGDLLELVDNEVAEGTTIDYKVELPAGGDEARREFLRDVSAFANTSGGHIVYGMTEDGGVASGVPGLELSDVEAAKLRLENMLRDGLAPRLSQHGLHTIRLENGRTALVFRLPRSWRRPHMVTFKGSSEFWARNSAGKYRLDFHEIRSAMLSAPAAGERIRSFRQERTAAVLGGEVPYPLSEGPKILLHLVPLDAVDEARPLLDISPAYEDSDLRPLYRDQREPIRWNVDGLYADDHWNEPEADSSVQLFRSGILEAVEGWMIRQGARFAGVTEVVQGWPFERTLVDGVSRYLRVLARLGVELPVFVLVGVQGIKGYRIQGRDAHDDLLAARGGAPRFDRDLILLPDVMIESWEADVPRVLKPLFDAFWQAGGRARSENYSDNGEWQRD
jgi:hypothetical protein